jgi:hypothetical protein
MGGGGEREDRLFGDGKLRLPKPEPRAIDIKTGEFTLTTL